MKIKEVLLILFISLLFSFPFFQKGFFSTHDGEWAIIRLAEMGRELRDLQIPPRWSDFLNHGYGYPLFLYTYPLPYYTGQLIHILGLGLTNTIKFLFIISTVISGFGMYFYAKSHWGKFGALVSSIFYLAVPYRLLNLYIRGSIGENIAMAIIPWLLYSIDKFIKGDRRYRYLITLLYAVLILSHNASALLFSLFIFFYLLFSISANRFKNFLSSIHPFVKSLIITAYFWIPIIAEQKYIYLGNFPLADKNLHFVSLVELIFPANGIGVKPPLFVGYLHLFILITSLFLYIKSRKATLKRLLLFNLIFSFAVFVLTFPISSMIWKLPGLSSIDFPWRSLMINAFLLSFLSGGIVFLPYGKKLGLVLVILAIFYYFPFVKVQERFIKADSYYESNDATTTSNDELMPVWVKQKPTNRPYNKINLANGEVSNLTYSSKIIKFNIVSDYDQNISVNTLFFPGWKFLVDEKKTNILPSPQTGLITLFIPKGPHQITGTFSYTLIRIIADSLSVFGIAWLLLDLYKFFVSKNQK